MLNITFLNPPLYNPALEIKPDITFEAKSLDEFRAKIQEYFTKNLIPVGCAGIMYYKFPLINPATDGERVTLITKKHLSPIDTLSCDQCLEKITNELSTAVLHEDSKPHIERFRTFQQNLGRELAGIRAVSKTICFSFTMRNDKGTTVSVKLGRELDHTCNTCEKIQTVGDQIFKCPRCPSTYYCNADCQRKDWSKHKIVCAGTTKP